MEPEELVDMVVVPFLVFCARARVRNVALVIETIGELIQGLEDRGFIDLVDEESLLTLIMHGFDECQRRADDFNPPLMNSQLRVLADLHVSICGDEQR